jgi:hypothetical protein
LSLLAALAASLVLLGALQRVTAAGASIVKTATLPTANRPAIADARRGPIAVAASTHHHRRRPRTITVTKIVHVLSTTNAPGVSALVSQNLAPYGSSIQSPRGPYRPRPAKLTFDEGGIVGSTSLWIDHLTWVDWGQPIAYASGIVHARAWPSANFITTPAGIVLYELRSCGTRSYYTMAAMFAPAGFPANSESTAIGESEQALTPCR